MHSVFFIEITHSHGHFMAAPCATAPVQNKTKTMCGTQWKTIEKENENSKKQTNKQTKTLSIVS